MADQEPTRAEAIALIRNAADAPQSPSDAVARAQEPEPEPVPEEQLAELEFLPEPDEVDEFQFDPQVFAQMLDAFVDLQDITPVAALAHNGAIGIEVLTLTVGEEELLAIGAAAKLHGCGIQIGKSNIRDGTALLVLPSRS
jgi:hypothetical protein